jgi:hypothetical protein
MRLKALLVVLLLVPALGFAKDNTVPVGCKSVNDVPGDFYNKCLLNGGDEVRCSGSTPMCCKTDSNGTRCYDTPEDVARKGKTTAPHGQPTPGTVAPGSSAPQTAPKQPKTTPKLLVPGKTVPTT